jgi:hypothetical protein
MEALLPGPRDQPSAALGARHTIVFMRLELTKLTFHWAENKVQATISGHTGKQFASFITMEVYVDRLDSLDETKSAAIAAAKALLDSAIQEVVAGQVVIGV